MNALNDPFLSKECFPNRINNSFIQFETPEKGGHVGFSQFSGNGLYWSEQRALDLYQNITEMIERYSIGVTSKQLAERFGIEEPKAHQARYNAAPSQLLRSLRMKLRRVFPFSIGGNRRDGQKNKTLAEKIINVRAEQILEKPVL